MSENLNEKDIEQLVYNIDDWLDLLAVGKGRYTCLFESYQTVEKENQFLFFIKPEVILLGKSDGLHSVLFLVFEKLRAHHFAVERICAIPSSYLELYNIMADHYGVINKLAKNARREMLPCAAKEFHLQFSKFVDDVHIVGGIEYLREHPDVSPDELNERWIESGFVKLAGGTYCARFVDDNKMTYVVNGFHPRQLQFYSQPEGGIICLTLKSSISWMTARREFVGHTDPCKARPGSLRNEFLKNKDRWDVPEISSSHNGFHFSAGSVEALVELCRFNSNLAQPRAVRTYREFTFGRLLASRFSENEIRVILNNALVEKDGIQKTIFELTEELDAQEAVKVLESLSEQLRSSRIG